MFDNIHEHSDDVSVCIGCGCDDLHACYDKTTGFGCSWVRLDREDGMGVCSECLGHVERWDNGDRSICTENIV